ncbi:DSD1 family PLP-dependent enzyme [Arenibaculum sp.]|uniref:DSD1 family PLP-dependent enzyme n=1 Tax=Arenibaculum sp. TaxID=2865862 RepID=UPI002E128567|nr:DSD1 family PLP-dependent enzyme [Arenibaculum sp.]
MAPERLPEPLLEPLLELPLDTPALVLDLDAMDGNRAVLAASARQAGIGLRPHAKTHKSAALARLQMADGAVGLCCAKLGEAEVLADAGIGDLLVTSPLAGARKLARLAALHARRPGLTVVVDSPEQADALAAALAGGREPLAVLIDVDVHPVRGRTGVTGIPMALETARRVRAAASALSLRGVQGYAGHVQHIPGFAERRQGAADAASVLRATRDALAAQGHPCPIVTGGGTGTFAIDPRFGLYTDLQPGSYLFSDVEYDAVDLTGDGRRPFRNALFVLAQVVSANHPGIATVDAGSKTFPLDGPMPLVAAGAPPGAVYEPAGDEFGRVVLPDGAAAPRTGERILFVVPHCDPTINLHDAFHCTRGGMLAGSMPIEARGRAD